MKKIVSVLLVLCLLAGLCACGGSKKADFNPSALAEDLLKSVTFTDSLDKLDAGTVPYIYEGISASDIADCAVYCGTGATAEEIAIFKAASDASAKTILECAQKRVADRLEMFKSYGPLGAEKLKNAIVLQKGVYVAVVVSADSSAAQKIVDKYM